MNPHDQNYSDQQRREQMEYEADDFRRFFSGLGLALIVGLCMWAVLYCLISRFLP